MRWRFCFALFALVVASVGPAPAQIVRQPELRLPTYRPEPRQVSRIELVTINGREMLEMPLTANGRFTGTLDGDPVFGARTLDDAGVERLAFVRMRGGAPWIAYVGARGGATGPRLTGVTYALRAAAGATNTRNAWSFIAASATRQLCPRGQSCPERPPEPPGATLAYPAGLIDRGDEFPLTPPINHRIGIGANPAQREQLDMTRASNGDTSGTLANDQIVGHFAASASTLALVRLSAGQPTQLYVGTLERGAPIGGMLYSLQAGQFEQSWSAEPTLITGLNSVSSGRCMTTSQNATTIELSICDSSLGLRQRWALIHVGTWRLVSMQTGLCASIGAMGAVTLAQCGHQAMRIDGSYEDRDTVRHIVDSVAPGQVDAFPHLRLRDIHIGSADSCLVIPGQSETPNNVVLARDCGWGDDFEEKEWWGKWQ
jgi:hypothetical protein